MASGGDPFKNAFAAFSKFGDTKSDGHSITLSQSDKWMKQAKVIDGKNLTTTDTGIAFNKFRSRTISLEDYRKFVEDLAKSKNLDPEDLMSKLMGCGAPGTSGTTQAVKVGAVDRLTDTNLYTGMHKERFDEEGKGKGIEGREYVANDSGYVSGYKEEGTYDKKVAKED
ncbi:unnamed protein product [Timema podura]|uniref:Tubulin polymerization-promoting protein homolog n=2 Tax=Timema TaxID=61471 RepID=A0A7R9JTM3_TIMGE|nr:unnamed protein product [Timema genevievae]CAG2059856.1 unnamed protein product [Timema podura]